MTTATVPLAMTRQEVAQHLRISVRQVDRLDAAGQLPEAFTVGKQRRWWTQEIKDYFAGGYTSRQQFHASTEPHAWAEGTPDPRRVLPQPDSIVGRNWTSGGVF